jgi:2-amino-4-hydroxy-6-hydroxymethyldihydropteridine diphosphokinase
MSVSKKTNNCRDNDLMAEYVSEEYHRVYIAVGSNMGNSYENVMKAISMLENTNKKNVESKTNMDTSIRTKQLEPHINVIKTSFLRQTPPMYVTDQAPFLNGALEIQTNLSPHALLTRLKQVEMSLGRDLDGNSLRFGPRPIDLDIIQYGVVFKDDETEIGMEVNAMNGGIIVESPRLSIPHPRMTEREFVMSPLCDLNRNIIHPIQNESSGEILRTLLLERTTCDDKAEPEAVHILPLPRGRMLHFNETHIMGILNVTPDSFSDGGNYEEVELAVKEALQMIEDGASIIDIGGESTRPGAKEVSVKIELERTIPVIDKIREGKIRTRYFVHLSVLQVLSVNSSDTFFIGTSIGCSYLN